ncbi:hypothetical protein ACWEKT_40560 [Nocardia takedensis]|uniref:hypothetical protein n=1 Tax=Nocardia takedensis TaxID=259390 RepID=UPI0012F6251B|nr:hypothetical protein [Nocardia takedensis]
MSRADRLCLVEPGRPTWIGDRLRVCEIRASRAYGIDLNAAWPRLWLIIPDVARAEIATVRLSFSAAANLQGWSCMYLVLGIWWWPAAIVGLVVAAVSHMKARQATNDLAHLVESAVDLYVVDLASQLGHATAGHVTPTLGGTLNTIMRKSRWDPDSPLAD